MKKVNHLSEADHMLVTAAVSAAEKTTDGEIVTIVTRQSDSYADVAWAVSGLVALLALSVISSWPDFYLSLWHGLIGGWSTLDRLPYWLFPLIATLKFFGTRLILLWRPLLLFLTPSAIKRTRIRRRAIELFRVGAEKRTMGLTGILIYVSLNEHRAEIVADEAIATKVAPEVWGEAMVALIDEIRLGHPGEGMAAAVSQVGVVLTEHFPKTDHNPNELPDRLIEL